MLEQFGDEAGQILALVGELLDEREQAAGVAVDDQVADSEQGLLLDGAEELQDPLHRDLAVRRGGKLIESRHCVAEASAGAPGDEGEGCVRDVDLLAVRDGPQELRQLG